MGPDNLVLSDPSTVKFTSKPPHRMTGGNFISPLGKNSPFRKSNIQDRQQCLSLGSPTAEAHSYFSFIVKTPSQSAAGGCARQ